MAIVLTSTKDRVTLVHTLDSDVQMPSLPADPVTGIVPAPKARWVPIGEAIVVAEQATRVVVRPLAGHEVLSCWGVKDEGEQSLAIVLRAVVTVDGTAPTEAVVSEWGWDVLLQLKRIIEGLSTGPTVARL